MNAVLKTFVRENRLNLLLLAMGAGPLTWIFFRELWRRPAYQFFPLALAGAGALAWRAGRKLEGSPVPGSPRWERILAGTAGLVFVAANVLWSPWLGFVALLLMLTRLAWSLGAGFFLAPLLILATIVPPPLGWDEKMTVWLATVAAWASSGMLDFLKVVHTLEGNTILLPGKSLLVAEACSGINSVVLCGAFCLFHALWRRRPLSWLVALLPLTCSFVVLGNVLRITVGAWLYYYWRIDWLSGWPHEAFGLALFAGYVLLVSSLDELLLFLKP